MADPAPRPPGLINTLTGGLFGGPTSFKTDPPRDLGVKQEVKYPGQEELDLGRFVDQFYGNPKAAFFEPGADIRKVDIKNAPEVLNDKRFENVKWEKIDQEQADKLYVAAVAANKSPLAGLGFDPRTFIASPPSKDSLTAFGAYSRKSDFIWADEKYPDTYVHESVHRGMEQLRASGAIARTPEEARTSGKMIVSQYEEELMTRAIMARHFGNVEREQPGADLKEIDRGEKMYLKNPEGVAKLNALEALAAAQIQKNTPMGPR